MSRDVVVTAADFSEDRAALHAIRETVFILGQGVPADIERDAGDAGCRHVIARAADGQPVGTGRIDAHGRIGRMAVLPDWRGSGVGHALLDALVDIGLQQELDELHLHAQAGVIDFYLQQGWLPEGERFEEAGIEHIDMRLPLRKPRLATGAEAGQAALCGVVQHARRQTSAFLPLLEPALFDSDAVQGCLRRLGTSVRGAEVRLLLKDATPRQASPRMVELAQRLPSIFQLRVANETVDLEEPSAWICNDRGGYWQRPIAQRLAGDYAVDAPGAARTLRQRFDTAWERARPCTELRILGL